MVESVNVASVSGDSGSSRPSETSASSARLTVPSAGLFKFCYIIRGLPGSGKSTVAAQLAGTTGHILNLDDNVIKHSQADGQ